MMRCYAFNMKGERCELSAAHGEDHRITVSWTDDECWTPNTETPTPQPLTVRGTAEPAEDPEDPRARCEACGHMRAVHMGDEGCSAFDSEMDERCSCFVFI